MSRRKQPGDLLDALFAVARTEAQKRKKDNRWSDKAGILRGLLMPIQALLESDPSLRISVRSPRQTGKSTGVLLIVAVRCLEKAMSEWVVVGLTRPSVKQIYWGALKMLNQQFELGIQFHNQDLTATFPNGSKVRFVGAENIGEIEKLRGGRYDGVVIDECKSFASLVFSELVHDVIEPALMAKNGQLFIIGTPGDILKGPFYEATATPPILSYDEHGAVTRQSNCVFRTDPAVPFVWSLHLWKMSDNVTAFPKPGGGTYTMWDQAQEIIKRNGWTLEHPTVRREYFGEWVPADLKRVYRYVSQLHDYTPTADTKWGIPEDKAGYKTVVGCDFGTRDGTAFVVWAWSPHADDLWEVYSDVKRRKAGDRLTVSQIAEWYKELEAEFGPFEGWPADPAGLATMVMDTLADEHGVYLEPAEKREKNDHIELFNNDLDKGRVHVRRGSALSNELAEGQWNMEKLDKGKREEDPRIPNDVADAGLYGYRFASHRRATNRPRPQTAFSPLWWAEQAARELTDAELRARDRASGDESRNLDRVWWNEPQ